MAAFKICYVYSNIKVITSVVTGVNIDIDIRKLSKPVINR